MKILTYLEVEIISYLFQDLILTYVPFYVLILNNWAIFITLWSSALILTNFLFGGESQ